MSKITEWYQKTRAALSKNVRLFTTDNKANLAEAPLIPQWFWMATLGVPRGIDSIELRSYAKSAWVQMVKRTIKNQLMTTEWDILNEDEEDENEYEEDIEHVTSFLNYPNRNGDTFWMVWGAFLDDVLDLDAGVIWKGRNFSGELVELFAHEGSRFLTKVDDHAIIDGYFQYSYKFPKGAPLFFENRDIIYGKIGVNTDQFPYGWSPLQSIQQIVEVMIQSDRFNKEFFQNNAIPDGLVTIPMEQEALERLETDWNAKIKGKPHKLAFLNSPDAKFTPMAMTNKDMQWLDGQKWYFHVVFGAYGLSPNEVGFYEDVNRAASESQERVSIKNAIKPYFDLIAEKINREIIPDLIGHDDIKFKWFPKDSQEEKIEHEQTMAKLNANVLTINEVRAKEGLDDVEWGDQPMSMTTQEKASEMNPKEEKDNKKEEKPKDKEKDNLRNSWTKSFISFFKKNG